MQIIDVLLLFSILGLFVIFILRDKVELKVKTSFVVVAFVLFNIHLFTGQAKWRFYILYLMVFALSSFLALKPIKRWLNRVMIAGLFFLLIASTLIIYAFPVYKIPEPKGMYPIGTYSQTIFDQDRLELYTEEPNDYRKFKIQMWYPAQTVESYIRQKWLNDGRNVTLGLSQSIGLPAFLLGHTADIQSNAYLNAPLSDDSEKYPVIIISHGWGGFRNLHTDFAEELASQGYIVVGIEHTYGSVATVFSQDEVAFQNQNALPNRSETTQFLTYASQLVYTYAGDVSKTLDYLEELNNSSNSTQFHGRLDLDRIGLLGHSTGGGAHVAIADDSRVSAILGLDAWVEPVITDTIEQGLSVPSLFLRSQSWEKGENNVHLYDLINNSNQASLYQIDGTTHTDFTMVYMYSPLTRLIGYRGSLNVKYLNSMLKTIILDFFDEHLRDYDKTTDITPWKEMKRINMT